MVTGKMTQKSIGTPRRVELGRSFEKSVFQLLVADHLPLLASLSYFSGHNRVTEAICGARELFSNPGIHVRIIAVVRRNSVRPKQVWQKFTVGNVFDFPRHNRLGGLI